MTLRTQIWLAVGFALLLTVLTIAAAVFSKDTAAGLAEATTVPALSASDWVRGNREAKVAVIVYGDFQCPACKLYEPVLKQLEAEYGNRVAFGFRNFPLYQIHKNAEGAARAAEAAGQQGKYWEMHDMLYDAALSWSPLSESDATDRFVSYAKDLSLDTEKFAADMKASATHDKIAGDVATGNDARVDHTPTFFVNNTQIVNPTNYEQFKSVLDTALGKAQ